LDVTDTHAVQTVADHVWRDWDGIDSVIYCPGAWEMADGAEFRAESALRQIDVNYLGLVRVLGSVIPRMVERHRGDIVGISSLSGFAGFPRAAAYSSSKAGTIALLQSLRIDLRKHGVGVTTVTPGFFESRLTEKNQFSMPFLMTVDAAADATVAGLEAGRAEISFPWQLSLGVKLLTRLPRPVFETFARRFMTKEPGRIE
jgi:short-subunit dehydrogenase